jgi:hypothetical protein
MSKDFEERLADWAVWYCKNEPHLPEMDLIKQVKFLRKAVDGAFECLALAAKDIQIIEQRRGNLLLPTGVTMNGDVRKFG